MTLPPGVRKGMLTAHVACSVGWLGAVAAFLALAVTGLTTQDTALLRATYLAMQPVTWWVIVPAAVGALLTGLVQALDTRWGLFRHYWVLAKLLVTVLAIALLLGYTQTVDQLAAVAADRTATTAELRAWAASPVLHASLALLALLVPAVLSVFKPPGLTRYGWRKLTEQRRSAPSCAEREN